MIIGHLDQIDNFSGEMLLVSKMKQIFSDIIAQMLNNYLKCETLAMKAIPGFNISSVSYEMLGPVFNNDYGLMYSFKLIHSMDTDFLASKWI